MANFARACSDKFPTCYIWPFFNSMFMETFKCSLLHGMCRILFCRTVPEKYKHFPVVVYPSHVNVITYTRTDVRDTIYGYSNDIYSLDEVWNGI